MNGMQIGRFAECAGVTPDTVRYYEKRGLMPEPGRAESGYRLYIEDDLRRLRFIRQAQELGFSLHEIAELLALRMDDRKTCQDVKKQIQAKMTRIEERIRQLQMFRRALTRLEAACAGDITPISECPVLEALDAEGGI